MKSVIIQLLESLLQAEFIGEYSPGHMGASVLRFKHLVKGALVVKIAADDGSMAAQDIADNLVGYQKIRLIGGGGILPDNLEELTVPGYKAIVMSDLGKAIRYSEKCPIKAKLLWLHYLDIVMVTRKTASKLASDYNPKLFIEEVLEAIKRFEGEGAVISSAISQSDLSDNYGDPALMLLDFTPDNVFMTPANLSFIDPWKQKSYLGHPAVSIGQFVTLCRIYAVNGYEEANSFLRKTCLNEMPKLIDCSPKSVEKAFRLGATLQLVLSAYVRRVSEPERAEAFLDEAKQLWVQ